MKFQTAFFEVDSIRYELGDISGCKDISTVAKLVRSYEVCSISLESLV